MPTAPKPSHFRNARPRETWASMACFLSFRGGSRISTPSSPAAFSGRRKRFLSAGPLPAVDAEDPEEEVEEDAEVRVEEEIEEDAIVEATAGERVVPRKQGWRSGSRRLPAK